MKNPRKESRAGGSLGDDVVRGDAAPVEREDAFDEYEAIRARAYELYLERGDGSGDDMNDWLQAEREYRERRTGGAEGGEAREQPGL